MANNKSERGAAFEQGGEEINAGDVARDPAHFTLLYTTWPDEAQALAAGRVLVEQRQVACVNILPGMTSVFTWQDKVETAREVVMVAKLPKSLCEEAMRAVRGLHPYDTPAIIAVDIVDGDADYLFWVALSTGPRTAQ